ncbi:hypothetical protein [Ponticaulis sp.]|uniref:hypothetical protein n=1 Tax=Ponticaulis sp. TaxID=2020902 RepID=UPI000B64CA47|nr:hypothetical protein [Ponticaulis sp.]MAI91897.1 hypothetical protein [Ponticaulis sp.]OUX96577.1 MAG: hypothetical protein CBB65_15815 [Hyphomonadaceae bacterium TMED5]|tara:strand:- start:16700 stop:17128 length:429 start_codon:yes stop_codon:yes gene_type:complete
MSIKHMLLVAATTLGLSGAAMADEVWSSERGNIVFLAELETGEAIIGAPVGDSMIRMIFPGLAFNYENRGMHNGIWIADDMVGTLPECDFSIVDPQTGVSSSSWGRAEILFFEKGYPSDIILTAGTCFGEPEEMLSGTALNQ